MNLEEIEQRLREAMNILSIELAADGNRLMVQIVSNDFVPLNRVKRQQLVYGALNELIASGEVHAVSMQTMTQDESADK